MDELPTQIPSQVPLINLIWNLVTTGVIGLLGFFAQSKLSQVDKIAEELAETQKQIALNYMPRLETQNVLDRLTSRIEAGFDKIDDKLDDMRKDIRDS